MNSIEFLLQQHARNHSARVATWEGTTATGQNQEDLILDGLTDAQLRKIPGAGLNSIAWLHWHIARSEDVGVSLCGGGRPQVWHAGGWAKKLKYERADSGTGMTAADVADLSARIDLAGLREYRWAVGRQTREIVTPMKPERFSAKIDMAVLRKNIELGSYRAAPDKARFEQTWSTRSVGYTLATYAVTHNIGHWGEVRTLKGML